MDKLRKLSKSIISLILIVSLMCIPALENQQEIVKAATVSYDYDIYAGDVYTTNISVAGDSIIYRFVPSLSGSYTFETAGSYDTYGYLYDSDMYQLTYDDDDGDSLNCSITYYLEAGYEYYFETRFYSSSETGSFETNLICEYYNLDSVFTGSTTIYIDAGGYTSIYAFTPTTSGTYSIYTTGSYDTYGGLYASLDSNGNVVERLTYDDDDGDSTNYSMSYYMYSGTTYYITSRMYSSSTTGSFTLNIESDSSSYDSASIYYDANGGSGAPSTQTIISGDSLYISYSEPYRYYNVYFEDDWSGTWSNTVEADFSHWISGEGNYYWPGDYITLYSDMTLYASWGGAQVEWLPTPTRSGYTFMGWYTSYTGGERVYESTYIYEDSTFYARWQKNADPIGVSTGEYTVDIDTAGEVEIYAFTPTISGNYTISSSGSYDTYGQLGLGINTDGTLTNLLISDDDSGDELNFTITYYMEAYTTYYIKASMLSSSETGSFPMSIYQVDSSIEDTTGIIVPMPEGLWTSGDTLYWNYNDYVDFNRIYVNGTYQDSIGGGYCYYDFDYLGAGTYTVGVSAVIDGIESEINWTSITIASDGDISINTTTKPSSNKPDYPTITKYKNKRSKKIFVKWKKVKNVDGYIVQYYDMKNKKVKRTKRLSGSAKSVTLSGFKLKSRYCIKIRCYRKVDGKTYYSGWSRKIKIKVKK